MPHHDEEGDTCKKGAAGRRHGEKKDKHHDEEGETCKDGAAGRRHEKKEGEHEHHGKPGHKHGGPHHGPPHGRHGHGHGHGHRHQGHECCDEEEEDEDEGDDKEDPGNDEEQKHPAMIKAGRRARMRWKKKNGLAGTKACDMNEEQKKEMRKFKREVKDRVRNRHHKEKTEGRHKDDDDDDEELSGEDDMPKEEGEGGTKHGPAFRRVGRRTFLKWKKENDVTHTKWGDLSEEQQKEARAKVRAAKRALEMKRKEG